MGSDLDYVAPYCAWMRELGGLAPKRGQQSAAEMGFRSGFEAGKAAALRILPAKRNAAIGCELPTARLDHVWSKDRQHGVTICERCGNTRGRATEDKACPGDPSVLRPAGRTALGQSEGGADNG